jgi:hypothetical protein
VALLVVAATLAIPFVIQHVEPIVRGIPDVFVVDPLMPASVAALAALVSWRAGWRLATWFCGLLVVQRVVVDSIGAFWLLLVQGQNALEPLRRVAAPWHPTWFRLDWLYVAAVVVASGAVVALLLRRMHVRWPIGLGIGVALVVSSSVTTLRWYLTPDFAPIWAGHPSWFRLEWLVVPAQTLAWATLTAAVLRRGGLTWPASLLTGTILWLLLASPWFLASYVAQLSPAPGSPLLEPAAVWAATIAALVSVRAAEPAPREAAPC